MFHPPLPFQMHHSSLLFLAAQTTLPPDLIGENRRIGEIMDRFLLSSQTFPSFLVSLIISRVSRWHLPWISYHAVSLRIAEEVHSGTVGYMPPPSASPTFLTCRNSSISDSSLLNPRTCSLGSLCGMRPRSSSPSGFLTLNCSLEGPIVPLPAYSR